MKISQIAKIPSIRIMLFLEREGEVRHTELSKVVASRGTLSLSLKELEEEELIQRTVLATKPFKACITYPKKARKLPNTKMKSRTSLNSAFSRPYPARAHYRLSLWTKKRGISVVYFRWKAKVVS